MAKPNFIPGLYDKMKRLRYDLALWLDESHTFDFALTLTYKSYLPNPNPLYLPYMRTESDLLEANKAFCNILSNAFFSGSQRKKGKKFYRVVMFEGKMKAYEGLNRHSHWLIRIPRFTISSKASKYIDYDEMKLLVEDAIRKIDWLDTQYDLQHAYQQITWLQYITKRCINRNLEIDNFDVLNTHI